MYDVGMKKDKFIPAGTLVLLPDGKQGKTVQYQCGRTILVKELPEPNWPFPKYQIVESCLLKKVELEYEEGLF